MAYFTRPPRPGRPALEARCTTILSVYYIFVKVSTSRRGFAVLRLCRRIAKLRGKRKLTPEPILSREGVTQLGHLVGWVRRRSRRYPPNSGGLRLASSADPPFYESPSAVKGPVMFFSQNGPRSWNRFRTETVSSDLLRAVFSPPLPPSPSHRPHRNGAMRWRRREGKSPCRAGAEPRLRRAHEC